METEWRKQERTFLSLRVVPLDSEEEADGISPLFNGRK